MAIEVIGGTTAEASGGEVSLDGGAVLQAVALELAIGEQRAGVVVSPATHLVASLGRARWQAGKEATFNAAVAKAQERVAAHLGFDPIRTAVAAVGAAAGSPTDSVKYGLVLAGLSEQAAQAAADQGVTVQNVNTVELTRVLARDAGSAEALLDGNGAEALYVGASCAPPAGCSSEGPGCYASCAVHTNTLRSRLGSAVLAFLLTPENGTGLTRDDVATWLEGMRTNVDGELFGTEATEPFDSVGPTITWVAPGAGATVAGTIAVEVTAADPVGVASLTVTVAGPVAEALVDTDPAPGRFAATWTTTGAAEGPVVLTAEATDSEANVTTSGREVVVNNIAGGTVSGLVYKGRVAGATVRAYGYANGVRGALVGEATTGASGGFANLRIADGYSGPLLVEAGFGGTYPEEAGSATVTLDLNERLRTVVPSYADGDAVSNLVVSPLTTFAVAYQEYLEGSGQGGATVAARWATARAAMETSFGVANVYDLTPQAPAEMTTFNGAARYGMVLVGLSETARQASTLGGGDGGTFGTAMTAMRVVRVLEQDVADGCWDGRMGGAGGTQLYFGGTRAVSAEAVRRGLANAIVGYLSDGARNQTPYAGAADVLGQLDALASGGGNAAPGSCTGAGAGTLHPDPGGAFDQTAPVVTFVTPPTPPAGLVRGTLTVSALATDNLDVRPGLRFTAPAGTADADGDETDADAQHTFVTTALADGPLAVSLEATDDAGNVGTASRTFTVDNTPPVIEIAGVADGAWYASARTVTFTHSDAHPGTATATLDGSPFTSGTTVSTEGRKVLVVTATDAAGNQAVRTVTFHVDLTNPTLALVGTPPPTWLRGALDVTVAATDTLQGFGALGTDIAVTATGPLGAVTPTLTYPATGDGSRRVRVQLDTTAIDDAQGGGTLTLRFDVTDRAGRAAAQLVVSRAIDNQPPVVTLLPVRNQAGAMIDGYVSEAAATIRGTVTPGGSPTTVAVTVTPGGTAMVTPDAAGTWSHTTGALAEGSYAISATASDEAGNTAVTPATGGFVVDRTGPTLSWDASSVRDELDCNATVFATTSANGSYVPGADPPIGYRCDLATLRDLVNTTNPRVGKFTTRLASTAAADNPIRFRPRATEGAGGVGLAAAASTVQFRIYRAGQTPPASWRDTVEVVDTGGTTVQTSAYALSTHWPELATHTAHFVIEVRATDRLGNPSATTVTRTWDHHPLAPPVQVDYVGPAPSTSSDPLYPHSIYSHGLVPVGAQTGPGTAMSGVMDNLAPRGLLEYRLLNHADQPVTVGFFVPVPSTWTYVRRLWERSPPANTAISPPSSGSLCGWPSASFRARSDDTTSPYSCTVSNCVCPGASWSVPVNSTPGPTTTPFPVPSPTNPQTGAQAPVLVRAFDADTGTMDELVWTNLQSTITVGATTYAFFEVTVPARPGPSKARYVRVLVSLRNLDLYAPHTIYAENVHSELSGTLPLENIGVAITGRFLERWVECNDFDPDNGNCTGLLLRRRVRALVEARLDVPQEEGRLEVRSRSSSAATAAPELLPGQGSLFNTAPVRWHTCENSTFTAGGTCSPSIP
ncbi:MAG: hypothetical protein HS111_28970 [Kofleriaceae bacterium]|nr:hypothetical protein [Kofleriaceae bacterium]